MNTSWRTGELLICLHMSPNTQTPALPRASRLARGELLMEDLLQVLNGAAAPRAASRAARGADLLRRRHVHAHDAHRLRGQHDVIALQHKKPPEACSRARRTARAGGRAGGAPPGAPPHGARRRRGVEERLAAQQVRAACMCPSLRGRLATAAGDPQVQAAADEGVISQLAHIDAKGVPQGKSGVVCKADGRGHTGRCADAS